MVVMESPPDRIAPMRLQTARERRLPTGVTAPERQAKTPRRSLSATLKSCSPLRLQLKNSRQFNVEDV
jgi:hypothetical protein